jgi:hypothetical protein
VRSSVAGGRLAERAQRLRGCAELAIARAPRRRPGWVTATRCASTRSATGRLRHRRAAACDSACSPPRPPIPAASRTGGPPAQGPVLLGLSHRRFLPERQPSAAPVLRHVLLVPTAARPDAATARSGPAAERPAGTCQLPSWLCGWQDRPAAGAVHLAVSFASSVIIAWDGRASAALAASAAVLGGFTAPPSSRGSPALLNSARSSRARRRGPLRHPADRLPGRRHGRGRRQFRGRRYRAVRYLAGRVGPRILVSRDEASVEEHPWARQDSRNVTGCCLHYPWRGARPACGCARCPGSVWSAAARSTSSSATLPCVWRSPRTGARARPRAAPGRCRQPARLPGDVSRCSCSWLDSARTRSPSSWRPCSGPHTRRARSAGGVSARCRRGDACCTRPSA